jgi:hypothetical protein
MPLRAIRMHDVRGTPLPASQSSFHIESQTTSTAALLQIEAYRKIEVRPIVSMDQQAGECFSGGDNEPRGGLARQVFFIRLKPEA